MRGAIKGLPEVGDDQVDWKVQLESLAHDVVGLQQVGGAGLAGKKAVLRRSDQVVSDEMQEHFFVYDGLLHLAGNTCERNWAVI